LGTTGTGVAPTASRSASYSTLVPVRRLDDLGLGVDRLHGPSNEVSPDLQRRSSQRDLPDAAGAVGLVDGERSIDELVMWSDEGELDAVAGQRVQPVQRLQARQAPPVTKTRSGGSDMR
jgi:hypothetical protein